MAGDKSPLTNIMDGCSTPRILKAEAGTNPGGNRYLYDTHELDTNPITVRFRNTGAIAISGASNSEPNLAPAENGVFSIFTLPKDVAEEHFVAI